jgi:hypothetical protein
MEVLSLLRLDGFELVSTDIRDGTINVSVKALQVSGERSIRWGTLSLEWRVVGR